MSSGYASIPAPDDLHASRGPGGTAQSDFAQGNPTVSSPLGQSAMQHETGTFGGEQYDAGNRSSTLAGDGLARSMSRASQSSTAIGGGVSRNNTLKKKSSIRRTGSLKRSGSKRSLKAGSIKGFGGEAGDHEDFNSAFYTPVPTSGTPTEILANRFQAWRQLLKSLITYFREIQASYEARAKALHKVQNTIANISHPAVFMSENGLGEATRILEDYHKRSISEANKSREIENDVIGALTGLRSDLGQKIKEIKSLSGDFKNSVEKEKEATRKEVEKLRDALQHASHHEDISSKNDPYVVRLGVDRAIEKQLDEENYLHRAYLNLESSGRELESIVVGEIQKAYNAFAGILKREGDDAYGAVESLRSGPISMPKDHEWFEFVTHDKHFVDPSLPIRRIEDIEYPGKHDPAASEIRAGMLERKSKYLKSYTPGWYVLSPTHLHEFKSADKIYSQPPVMSLYLGDQKLGSHSERGSSSHKFMLKGKQSGGMHKGHNWVFRAESYETMMAWFEDIRMLTEKTGAERQAFVRKHARSVSGTSDRGTVSSDGMEEDEADQTPYSADVNSLAEQNPPEQRPQRPQPGGRFPSDMAVRKVDPDGAEDSDDDGPAVIAAAGMLPGAAQDDYSSPTRAYGDKDPYHMEGVRSASFEDGREPSAFTQQEVPAPVPATAPVQSQTYALPIQAQQPTNQQQPFLGHEPATSDSLAGSNPVRHNSSYADWMAPAAAGVAGLGAGALGADAYRRHQHDAPVPVPEPAESSALNTATMAPPAATTTTTATTPGLGGNEREGAHVTGEFFPRVVRHDTDLSVSKLHVPGEYPAAGTK